MKILIIAAGEGTRWGNFRDTPKHLVTLAGERLLDRTVRLCNELAPDASVSVVVADTKDDRYKVPGSRRSKAKLDPTRHDADKFASSRHLWAKEARTVILYGDVWFSRAAMSEILADTPGDWHAFHRIDGSIVTGATGGECFAFAINPEAHELADAALDRIIDQRRDDRIWRNGGWEWYRALAGVPDEDLLEHRDYGHNTIIDDFTEDMDGPADWDNWCWHWAQATVKPE